MKKILRPHPIPPVKFLYVSNDQEGGGGGGEDAARPDPEAVRQARNNHRLSRMEEIARSEDARRAPEMMDVDGERVTGRFQNGEFDDSPEALARQAELEQAARDEEAERLEEEEAERAEARRLQGEGAAEDPPESAGGETQDEADEKVVDGVRYYRCIVAGQERWLTLKQLRESAAATNQAEETLQRAQEALRSASQAELTPKEAPVEVDDSDLENIILSASMGDEEAVKKLVSVIKRPAGIPQADVSRLVTQQIATQRVVDRAEATQEDLLSNELLAPIFRQRLRTFADAKPTTRIEDAYKAVGDQMRKDFAPMLANSGQRVSARPGVPRQNPPGSKADRKRTIVNPPQSAGRQPARQDEDREVPVSEQIDAIARARGQQRAHRIRRS